MTRHVRTAGLTGALALIAVAAASIAAIASAGPVPEDDLTVVKRAVAQAAPREAAPARRPESARPEAEEKVAERRARPLGKEATWLKVRVTDKSTGRRKVTVNVPLALVRAMGDGWPRIDFECGDRHARCAIKVSEILAALESGQDLVEIDEEDESVRVWVE